MPTVYRIVQSDPPTRKDFLSYTALGKRLKYDTPRARRLADGLSVFDTAVQARDKARAVPWLGSYIAALDIPEAGEVEYERTASAQGHRTIWGSPEAVMSLVVSVTPVDAIE